jgi:hypothetical protein
MHKRTKHEAFATGHHRPVYLWGGQGTVRMNRLKFMGAAVDEQVHTEAHTAVGARRMAAEAGFNWAYLMYNWGFPPEVEGADHEEFCRAVGVYQAAGIKVFGYVQASNCVYDGSYRDKDWYAQDPWGRRYHYYTGRYMTCWSHPEWLDHLRRIVKGIIEAGADGVFYDNPWHGIQPLEFGGTWMGPAGCYCGRCRDAFRRDAQLEMPELIDPAGDQASQTYIRWRARQVSDTLRMLSEYARSLEPGIVIAANNFDAVMRPSYLVYGIDLAQLARVQDVVVIEDYGLPRWRPGGPDGPALNNNALTLHTARAFTGDAPLSTIPYDLGIGFDPVYSPRRFQQGIAEAAACGATMVAKGTEYVQDGTFTLLTAREFAPQRQAIGQIHRWLANHAGLYRDRVNAAPVALLHPGDGLWIEWNRLAAPYLGVGQALLVAGVPWRVVTGQSDLAGIQVLLSLGPLPPGIEPSPQVRVVDVLELDDWQARAPSFLARHHGIRSLASRVVGWLFQSYFRHRLTRRIVDGTGLVHHFWGTSFFRLPPPPALDSLQRALGPALFPRVTARAPVLITFWRKGAGWQIHLVNYGPAAQQVEVELGGPFQGRMLSAGPGRANHEPFQASHLALEIDTYLVLELAGEAS